MYDSDKDKNLQQKLARIKIAAREELYPMFSDKEIKFYLEEESGSVRATIYRLLTLKAETGSVVLANMTLPDPERYFHKLAMDYRPNNGGVV